MTAICYSQLSGFRSPWGELVGGVDKRLADLLGLLLLPLLAFVHRASFGLYTFAPFCLLLLLFISFFPVLFIFLSRQYTTSSLILSLLILYHHYFHLCSLLSLVQSSSIEEICGT